MTRTTGPSIALVGSENPEAAEVGRVLEGLPGVTLQRRDGTLTQLNGTAIRLSASHDVVLFRADSATDLDLEAIQGIHGSPDRRAVLVALAPPDIPLAEARRLLRSGVADVLPWTVGAEELREHVERWTRPSGAAPERRGRIVVVAQARGGIGASTLAVNLADRLMDRRGLRRRPRNDVVLVDLDLQWGTLASLLDLQPSDALWEMASSGLRPDATFVSQALSRTKGGLAVLTAPQRLAPIESLKPEQVGALLDVLATRFDHVVVDLPRCLVDWVGTVVEKADRLLLATDCSVPTVRQARRLLDVFLEDNPQLPVEVVMCQERKPLIRAAHHVEAQRLLGLPLRHWLPFDAAAARHAADRGAPLSAAARGSRLAKAIAALGRASLSALATPRTTAPAAAPTPASR